MRTLTYALAAHLLLAAQLAEAATLTATPATLAAVTKAAQSGDVVTMPGGGSIVSVPLKDRPDNITIDLTGVTITGDTRTGPFNGITLIGGHYTGAIPFTFTLGGKGLVLRDMEMVAPALGAGAAITVQKVDGVTVSNVKATGYKNGLVTTQVSNLDAGGIILDRTQRDCFNLSAVWTARIHHNRCTGNLPVDGDHPDAAQILSLIGLKPTSDIVIEDNYFAGPIQGPTTTSHGDDPGFDRITYRRNTVVAGFPIGFGADRVRGLILEDNALSTLPGSAYPSRFWVGPLTTDATWVGTNTQAAYGGLAAVSYPPTVPPDPKDVEISALKAQLAAAEATVARLTAAIDATKAADADTLELARQAAVALRNQLDDALARIAAASAALSPPQP